LSKGLNFSKRINNKDFHFINEANKDLCIYSAIYQFKTQKAEALTPAF